MSSSDTLAQIQQLTKQPPSDAHERRQVYNAARELLYATESQADLVQRLLYTVYSHHSIYTGITVC